MDRKALREIRHQHTQKRGNKSYRCWVRSSNVSYLIVYHYFSEQYHRYIACMVDTVFTQYASLKQFFSLVMCKVSFSSCGINCHLL